MVDCFISEKSKFDGFRLESFPVKANGDGEAIREAKFFASTKSLHHFHLRAAVGKGYAVIYRSEDA
jgi:hypothetical protein